MKRSSFYSYLWTCSAATLRFRDCVTRQQHPFSVASRVFWYGLYCCTIRSDLGLELKNSKVEGFFKKEGIRHYTPTAIMLARYVTHMNTQSPGWYVLGFIRGRLVFKIPTYLQRSVAIPPRHGLKNLHVLLLKAHITPVISSRRIHTCVLTDIGYKTITKRH